MSVTYPADPTKPYGDRLERPRVDPHAELAHEEPFVPVYARRGKTRTGQSKIKAWMILVPVGVLVLGGIGAMLVMNGGEETSAPLAEPAATAPVLSATPAPTEAAVVPPTPASTPAPVVREAAPLRRPAPAPARRETTARVQAPAATPRVATPAPTTPTGPQSYTPAPAASPTSTLNTAPATPASTPASPPPPPIVVQPLG